MKELFKLAAVITMEGLEGVRNGLNTAEKEAKKLSKTLVQTGQKIESIGSKMSMMITLPVAAATAGILKLTDGASDLSETISKSEQIFGDAAKQIDEWSNSSAVAMGQSKKQAIDAASTFAIFGKSAGMSGDELVGFSTKFTQLASDFASFYNTKPEDAITAIGAAFRGENEPIRKYGVLLDDASMRQEALKLGIIDSIKNALTPQQKVMAASSLIMKQTSDAQGDFQRTSGGLANQQKILSAEIKNLADDLGKAFLPTVTNIVKIIRGNLVPILKTTANIIKQIPPDILSFAAGMGIAAAAIGPLLLGLGKALTAYKDIQIAIKGVTFLLAGNPFGLAVMGVAAITGAVIGLVNEYKNLQKEHQKYVLQTTEKAAIDEFTNRINNLKRTIAQYGDELKDPAKAQEILGKQIQEATEFARQLGYTVEGDLVHRMNKLAIISDKVNGVMYKYVKGKMVAIDYTKLLADQIKNESNELTEEQKKLIKNRDEFEKRYKDKIFEQESTNDIQLLEKQYKEELEAAAKLGADKNLIDKWYQNEKDKIVGASWAEYEADKNKEVEETQKTADRIAEIDKQLAETRKQLEREVAEERKQQTWGVVSFISDSFNQLGSILSMFNSNRLDEIDQWEARQREEIENSMLSEEEKASRLEELNEQKAKKEKEIRKRQAVADKAAALFSIAIDTAMGIAKIWSQSGVNFIQAGIMSGILGTISTIQAAIVAAKPIPMAEGSLVKSGTGGIFANIGEGREDEVVFPLSTGVKLMVDELFSKIQSLSSPSPQQQPIASGGGLTISSLNVNVYGNWLGDEAGLNRLAREMAGRVVQEYQRIGATA